MTTDTGKTSDLNELALDGYTVRPLVQGDARAVFELMAACELEATGEVDLEEADIVADWQRPSFDLATQSIGVLEGERLIAYAEVAQGRRADAAVAPDRRGRGIGTELARWTQRISRRDGTGVVGMPLPAGSPGEQLLRGLGYEVAWTSWVLELPEGSEIGPQPLPDGYRFGVASTDEDRHAAHDVVEDAFLEWSERGRETYQDFEAGVLRRPGFEPWNLRLVLDPENSVVGVSVIVLAGDCGYVDKLAVRRDRRGLGLARALLADSFAAAREHGATRSELSTDTRTGALGLYERVGMQVKATWRHWAIDTSQES